ncbi:lethal (2) 34Fc [Carabus blaptoides fortunei]
MFFLYPRAPAILATGPVHVLVVFVGNCYKNHTYDLLRCERQVGGILREAPYGRFESKTSEIVNFIGTLGSNFGLRGSSFSRVTSTMAFKYALCLAVMVCTVAVVHGYSGGAPVEVCDDMKPKHPAAPKKSTMPYKVSVNSDTVTGGGVVKITVEGNNGHKGVLVQVRHGEKPVGKFLIAGDDKYVKTIDCGEGEQNAATHKNAEIKKVQTFEWQAPKGLKDTVQVYVTVAQDGATYWVKKPTVTIKVE